MRQFEVWNMIEGAPQYIINQNGEVRLGSRDRSLIKTRRTKILGRRYVNLIVDGKVKRFYIEPLIKKYFMEPA